MSKTALQLIKWPFYGLQSWWQIHRQIWIWQQRNSSEKSFKWFMNTHCCGHADGNCIYIHVKPLITLNTSYSEEVCYIFNDKTIAALKPPQYVVFGVCPYNMSRILKCQFPSQLFELICHNTFTVLTSSQDIKEDGLHETHPIKAPVYSSATNQLPKSLRFWSVFWGER